MMEPSTITGARQFGRIWRQRMRDWLMPSATHACTNSRRRKLKHWARTSRAIDGHETMPIASTVVRIDGLKIVTSTITKMKFGMVWKTSVKRISTSSTQPPR